jgi:non-specific serine/threonine protein kinase/serine/threonine-protein kinase
MNDLDGDAKAIFIDALDQETPQAVADFLDKACGGDEALRARAEELLLAYQEAGNFLGGQESENTIAEPGSSAGPGTVIGPYKLVERIGDGGFGVVFLAEQQQPVHRQVAVKILKPGMDTPQVVARFEAERQALALMDHPNVAKVLDAGQTPSGRPYFVMELVKGIPITQYCDEHQLTVRERLALLVPVCRAIQHAHQKGIIHRDLKPTNILVAAYDGSPVPKVIDFGVAKALGQRLTERTLVTGFRGIIGTPQYMSPEQADFNALDIDTRADIYSLGVLLYELMTGTTPLTEEQLTQLSAIELLRLIREEDPPKPSSRLSKYKDSRASISARRRLEPARLTKELRGELDWIVMKCLEKERTQRYQTADGLARDIERYLSDQPVEACPPRTSYRLRKFVKRNKGRVVAAALVLTALLAGMAGTTWSLIRAEQARDDAIAAQRAETERAEGERHAKEEVQKRLAQIEKGTDILASVFGDLDPEAADQERMTLLAVLGRRMSEATQQLEGETLGDPLIVARLQHVLGISLRGLGYLAQAERVLVKACQTREQLLGASNLDTVASKHELALLYREQGKYALAQPLYEEVLKIRTAQLGIDHPDTLATRHGLAVVYHSLGDYVSAETLYKEVLAARTAQLGAHHLDTLTTQSRLGLLYRSQGKLARAQTLVEEVLAVRTAKLGPDHLATVAIKDNLAQLYCDQGKYALAQELSKDVVAVHTAKLGADHPDTLTSKLHWASLHRLQKNYQFAETLTKEVLVARTTKLGPDHPSTLQSEHELARIYQDQGKFTLAESLYKQLLQVRTAKLGIDHPETRATKNDLAGLYRSMNKPDRSIPLLKAQLKSGRD